MDASLELAQLRQELSLLEHVLQLEKERRIQAERQAEAEKQACLQLQLLLIREKKLRKAAGTWAPPRQGNAGRSSAAEQVDPANSSPPRKNTSGSDGNNSALSQLDELTSSIFSDLPDDVQEMLGQWGPGQLPLLCVRPPPHALSIHVYVFVLWVLHLILFVLRFVFVVVARLFYISYHYSWHGTSALTCRGGG